MKAYFVPRKPRKRKSNKRIPILVVLFLLGGMLTFVSGRWLFRSSMPQSPVETQETKQESAREQGVAHPRIGVILPLSGAFQREGEMLRAGISQAWKEMQAEGAQAELVALDGGKEASEAVRVARELVSSPDIVLVVAHLPTAVLSELIPIFEEAKVPLLVPANSHESLTHHRWIIPFVSCDHVEGICAASLAARWARDGGATVIHESGPYGLILAAGFKDGAQKERFAVKTVACDIDDPSMSSLVEQALQGSPPVIWLAGSPVWGAKIVGALMAMGFKGRLLAPQSYGRMIPDDLFGDFASRLSILWQVTATDSETNGMPDFRKNFLQSFLREPDWMAVLGYDAMRCAGKALQDGQITRVKAVEHFLHYNSPSQAFQGVGGALYFDAKGLLQRPFHLAAYRHGKLTPISGTE